MQSLPLKCASACLASAGVSYVMMATPVERPLRSYFGSEACVREQSKSGRRQAVLDQVDAGHSEYRTLINGSRTSVPMAPKTCCIRGRRRTSSVGKDGWQRSAVRTHSQLLGRDFVVQIRDHELRVAAIGGAICGGWGVVSRGCSHTWSLVVQPVTVRPPRTVCRALLCE